MMWHHIPKLQCCRLFTYAKLCVNWAPPTDIVHMYIPQPQKRCAILTVGWDTFRCYHCTRAVIQVLFVVYVTAFMITTFPPSAVTVSAKSMQRLQTTPCLSQQWRWVCTRASPGHQQRDGVEGWEHSVVLLRMDVSHHAAQSAAQWFISQTLG